MQLARGELGIEERESIPSLRAFQQRFLYEIRVRRADHPETNPVFTSARPLRCLVRNWEIHAALVIQFGGSGQILSLQRNLRRSLVPDDNEILAHDRIVLYFLNSLVAKHKNRR